MQFYAAAAAGIADAIDALDIDSKQANKPPSRSLLSTRKGSTPAATPAPATTTEKTTNPVVRARIAAEFASLRFQKHCPLGMYLTPSPDNILLWSGVFFVHQGYYADAVIKFHITFPSDYPNRAPAVRLLTDVFHPLVAQDTGNFNLTPRFRPWRPDQHRVFDVLHYLKAAFKKHVLDRIEADECPNKEAFRYHESTSSFAALASQSASLSQSSSALYDADHPSVAGKGPYDMAFSELDPAQLSSLREQLGLSSWKDEPDLSP